MSEIVFEAWPKIPRLNRNMIVTEKIDGTNAAVIITESGEVGAQSRNRLITPESDNYGFARWVHENREMLVRELGEGRHFGEWWGLGIQRGYGLTEKRFSLFNTSRWTQGQFEHVPQLDVVPVLYVGPFNSDAVSEAVEELRANGSVAAPGFGNPEGVVVFQVASRDFFKVTLDKDEQPKGVAA